MGTDVPCDNQGKTIQGGTNKKTADGVRPASGDWWQKPKRYLSILVTCLLLYVSVLFKSAIRNVNVTRKFHGNFEADYVFIKLYLGPFGL